MCLSSSFFLSLFLLLYIDFLCREMLCIISFEIARHDKKHTLFSLSLYFFRPIVVIYFSSSSYSTCVSQQQQDAVVRYITKHKKCLHALPLLSYT